MFMFRGQFMFIAKQNIKKKFNTKHKDKDDAIKKFQGN